MNRSLLLSTLALLVASCGGTSTDDFDGDGSADPVDCAPDDPSIHSGAAEHCSDGIDNDCDSWVDCDDNDCLVLPECGAGDDDDTSGDDDDTSGDDDDTSGDDDDTSGDDDDTSGDDDDSAGGDDDDTSGDDDDSAGDDDDSAIQVDSDGDGIFDDVEGGGDFDGDGIPNYLDSDSDDDGIPDQDEGLGDVDGDGASNYLDDDSDGDGILDLIETASDTDGDGVPNYLDDDSDGDGILDLVETASDTDGDGVPNYLDDDSDGDGILDSVEAEGIAPQGITMLALSGGSFVMGCTLAQQTSGNCGADESPDHSVTLSRNFWLSETEITQGQYLALMSTNPSSFGGCGLDCPVETINWWDAVSLANALSAADNKVECYSLIGCSGTAGSDLNCSDVVVNSPSGSPYDCEGYRLPMEAEWEFAARAGTDLLYAGSNAFGDVAWSVENSSSTPQTVGTLQPNAWGLYDMSGNVWEWVWDWYDAQYYSSNPVIDPEGPSAGVSRINRGAWWGDGGSHTSVANRSHDHPGAPGTNDNGIRLARTIPVDSDGDGAFMHTDCDDTDPSIYPQAGDTYGDGVDSDCDGLDCEAAAVGGAYFAACHSPTGPVFTEASAACIAAGYDDLASIRSTAEQGHVVGLLSSSANAASHHVFGYSDIASEGVWVWSDGYSGSFTAWDGQGPNNCCGGQHFAVMGSGGSLWDDLGDASTAWAGFICSSH